MLPRSRRPAGRSRNPDIEAVGPAFGVLIGF
jgi:hypothetical protein